MVHFTLFLIEVGTATVSSCHIGTATLDAGAGVAGWGPWVHDDIRLGT
jgi:hypothetical protein